MLQKAVFFLLIFSFPIASTKHYDSVNACLVNGGKLIVNLKEFYFPIHCGFISIENSD